MRDSLASCCRAAENSGFSPPFPKFSAPNFGRFSAFGRFIDWERTSRGDGIFGKLSNGDDFAKFSGIVCAKEAGISARNFCMSSDLTETEGMEYIGPNIAGLKGRAEVEGGVSSSKPPNL